MKKRTIILMALMGVMVWTGCQVAEENVAGEEDVYTWTLVVKAQKMDTKALAIGEGTEATTTELKSVWEAGDEVAVYRNKTLIGTLTATPDADDAHQATLSGDVTTSGLTAGSTKLTLLTPRTEWDYTGQDGTLLDTEGSIEKKYHYTLASSVLVTEVSGNRITTAPATFVSQQSIYRLSFRYQKSTDSKVPITASSVTISGASNKLVRSRTISGSPVYGSLSVKLGTATAEPFFRALLLPPIPPSISVFSHESTLRMRWPEYWSFSFSISPSNEHPGLISFRMD